MTETEFETVFKRKFKPLSNIAFSILKDEDNAKDIVQQVFLKLWDRKEKLSIHSSLSGYLTRSVINTSLGYIEKNKKIQFKPDYNEEDNRANDINETPIPVEELKEKINQAIAELPPKCRNVFSLSRYAGMTNKEIASELGISIKAVEKHIGKALKELRISLKPLYNSLIAVIFFIIEVGFVFTLQSYYMVCIK